MFIRMKFIVRLLLINPKDRFDGESVHLFSRRSEDSNLTWLGTHKKAMGDFRKCMRYWIDFLIERDFVFKYEG